jgi:4-hydroxybenzoate polyprenyltransferase
MDWKSWAQLIRIPNTLTSCADVLAGMCIAGGAAHSFVIHPVAGVVLSLASIAMYWGGMVLNDVWDLEIDRQQGRPGPLVLGKIGVATARRSAIGLLVAGVFLTALGAGSLLDSTQISASRLAIPVGLACVLVGSIVNYDGPMKRTPLAPAMMGICRGLNMALGMATIASGLGLPLGPSAIPIVIGHATYVTGLTIAARREADLSQSRIRLMAGWGICAAGAILIAFAPSLEGARALRLGSTWVFPCLILVLMLPLARRAIDSIATLNPPRLGMAIKQAIVSIVFLDAALALHFAGDIPGLIVCSLVIPTLILGTLFRTT